MRPHQEEHPEEPRLHLSRGLRNRVLRNRDDSAGSDPIGCRMVLRRYSGVGCHERPAGGSVGLRTCVETTVAVHLKWRPWTISVESPFLMRKMAATRSLTKIA